MDDRRKDLLRSNQGVGAVSGLFVNVLKLKLFTKVTRKFHSS